MNSAIFIIFWFVVIILAFFVLVVRPQRRRVAAHKALIDRIKPGDQIITSGGLIGEVVSIEPATMRLRIDDGVEVHIARGAVAQVIPDVDALNADAAEAEPAPEADPNPGTDDDHAAEPTS